MNTKPLLGELLVEKSLVPQSVINQALKLQIGGNRRLGYILVRMGAISDDQLADVLSDQLDIPIIDIASTISTDVRKAIPRFLCKKYGVLPLHKKENNVLAVAMANPSDLEAITDLEHYTGSVIEPHLARHSDIDREIPRRVPLAFKDIITQQVNIMTNRAIACIALACVIALAIYTYNYIDEVKHGTTLTSDEMVLYHHHDLTLAVFKEGGYSLQGRGAFASGLYKAEFTNLRQVDSFISQRERDFSRNQKEWLQWAVEQAGRQRGETVE